MTNQDKYDKSFMDALDVQQEQLNEKLIYNSVKAWDSVGHMALMASIEGQFDIMIETDDIVDFSSYSKGKEILSKYGVEL